MELGIDIFPWDAHFNTGIDTIDFQHRELVGLLNRLARHLASGTGTAALQQELLQGLLDYTHYHFTTEERLWEEGIPDRTWIKKHHKAHQGFADRIQTLARQASQRSDFEGFTELLEFLTHWLAAHILDADRRMAIVLIEMRDHGAGFAEAQQRAEQAMSGVVRTLMNAVLGMYAKLSGTSVQLMREQALRAQTETELQRLHNQRMQDALERQASDHEARLDFLAYHDSLTGAYNRNGLLRQLRELMHDGVPLAVVSLDLDNFQHINHILGAQGADHYLRWLARHWQKALGAHGTVARTSGDEFLVLVRPQEQLPALLEQLHAVAAQPYPHDGATVHSDFCAGITQHPQKPPLDPDTLVRQADFALYRAKQLGKHQVQYHDETEERCQREQHALREALRRAIEHNELVLHYQPKVQLATGALLGLEALVRWQHPERGLLGPMEFLPSIENHPLDLALGEWVIRTALAQMHAWQQADAPRRVSVNLSAQHLQSSNFAQRLQALLAEQPQLPAGLLDLEVLETVALDQFDAAIASMRACLALGVSFSLDDFGTGYSSLAYLQQLPVQTLKIDQSFVRTMQTDAPQPMLQAVIGLAQAFGMQVIAEGIETEAQGARLLALGCTQGQGYAIARPMPAAEVPAWLAQWQPPTAWQR